MNDSIRRRVLDQLLQPGLPLPDRIVETAREGMDDDAQKIAPRLRLWERADDGARPAEAEPVESARRIQRADRVASDAPGRARTGGWDGDEGEQGLSGQSEIDLNREWQDLTVASGLIAASAFTVTGAPADSRQSAGGAEPMRPNGAGVRRAFDELLGAVHGVFGGADRTPGR